MIEFKILDPRYKTEWGMPEGATSGSAGIDLRASTFNDELMEDGKEYEIYPDRTEIIGLGIGIFLDQPTLAGFLYTRSGNGCKRNIVLANGIGVIDSDYQNEIKACVRNEGDVPFKIKAGDRLVQYVIQPIAKPKMGEVLEFSKITDRYLCGLGSTGKK